MDDRRKALRIENVSFSYGDTPALEGVTFDVTHGALFGILGPNGSGKTTLFRLISTLLRPADGRLELDGIDIGRDPEAVRKAIGTVFQQPALDEELTIRENVQTTAALYGMGRADAAERIRDLARGFDLDSRLDDRVSTLSGGLKRRADLVRGLVHRPEVLLLDEPTSALDPVARRAFWDHLGEIRRNEGTTMIAATHLMDEAARCDVLAILDLGRVVAFDSPARLLERLGGESMWIDSSDPEGVMEAVSTRFGWTSRLVGRTVQIVHDNPYDALGPLHESLGSMIASAMIRRPTLEDVFIELTGRRFTSADSLVLSGL